jgi:hypothetical protein
MHITVFKSSMRAIQEALLDIMGQKNYSNGSQRMIILDPCSDKLSSTHLESLLLRKEELPLNRYTAFFYSPLNSPNFVSMVTTIEDGWYTLFNALSLDMNGESYRISVSDKGGEFYSFQSYQRGKERVVYVMEELKWTFYERGERLPFEQSDAYAKRRVRDRLNEPMLMDYLLKVGVDARHSSFHYSPDSILAFYYAW